MKKRYRTFLASLMSLTLLSTSSILLPVNAENFSTEDSILVSDATNEIIEVDGLRYKETDDYMLLCGVADTSVTSITIPATVNGMAVSIQNGDRGRAFE